MANKARLAKSLVISVAVNTAVVSAVGSSHLLHGLSKGKPDIEKMLDARPLQAYPRPNVIALPTPTPTPPPIAVPNLTSSASKNAARALGTAAPLTDAATQLVSLQNQSDASAGADSAQSAPAGQGEGKAGQNKGSGTGHLTQNKGGSRSGTSARASRATGTSQDGAGAGAAAGEGAIGSSRSEGAGQTKSGGSDAASAGAKNGDGAGSGARSGGSRPRATGRQASSAQHGGEKAAVNAYKNGTSRPASQGRSAGGERAGGGGGQNRVLKTAEGLALGGTKASGKATGAKTTARAGRAATKAGAAQGIESGTSGERLADAAADANNATAASSFVTPPTKPADATKRAAQTGATSGGESKSGSATPRASQSKSKATLNRTRVALSSTTPSLDAADAQQNASQNTKTMGAATSKQSRPEADDQNSDDMTGTEDVTPAPDETTPAPAPATKPSPLSHVVLKNWNAAPGQKITLPEKLDLSLLKDLKDLPVSSVQLTDEQREQIRKMLEGQDLKQIQGMDKSLLKKLIDASKRADKVPEDAAEDFEINKPEHKHGPKRAGAPRSRGERKKRDPRDEFALLPTGLTSPFRYRPWSPAYRSRYERVVHDPVESETRIAAVPGLQQQISGLMDGKSPRDVAAATGVSSNAAPAATPTTGTRFAANTPIGTPDATASNPQTNNSTTVVQPPANGEGNATIAPLPSSATNNNPNATGAPATGAPATAPSTAPANAGQSPVGAVPSGNATNVAPSVGALNNAPRNGNVNANPGAPTTNGAPVGGATTGGAPGAANGGQVGGAPTTGNGAPGSANTVTGPATGALGGNGPVVPTTPGANNQMPNGTPGGVAVGGNAPAGATQNGQPGVPSLGGVGNLALGGQPGVAASNGGVNAGNTSNGGTVPVVGGAGGPTRGGANGAAQTGGQPNAGATSPGGLPGSNNQPGGLGQANTGQPGGQPGGANNIGGAPGVNNGAPIGGNNAGGAIAGNNGAAPGGNAPGGMLGGAQGQPGQGAPVNGGAAPGAQGQMGAGQPGAQGQPGGQPNSQGQPRGQGQQGAGAPNGGMVMQGGGSPTGGGFVAPNGGANGAPISGAPAGAPNGGQPSGGGQPGANANGGQPGGAQAGGQPGGSQAGGQPGGGQPGGGQPGGQSGGGSASQGGASGGFGSPSAGGGTANVDFGDTQTAPEPDMPGEVDWGAALESEDAGQDVSVGDTTLKEMRRANSATLADLLPAGAPTSVGQQPNLPEHNYAQQKGLPGALVLPPLPPLGTTRGLNPQPRPVARASRPTPSRSAIDALVLTPKAVRAQSKALEARPRAQSESTEPKAFQAGQVAAPRFVRRETQKLVEAQQPSSPPLQETPPAAPFGSLSERGTIALVPGKGERLPLGDPTGQLEASPGASTNALVARRGVPSRFAKIVGPSRRIQPQARRDGSDQPAQEKQSQERRSLAALQGEEGDVIRQAMPGTLDGVGDEALLVPGQERDVKAQPGATEPVLKRVDEVAPEDGLSAIEKKARNSRGVKDGSLSPIPPTPLPDSDAELGDGSGLKGEYFSGRNFEQYEFTRADKNLDLFWGGETSPSPKLPVGGSWAARWTGRLKPRYSETYTLYATADDGVRVWIDHKLVIDGWGLHPVQEYAAELKFEAGKQYNIRVDYFEDGGPPAAIGLYWESKSQKKEFLPEECLFYPLAGSKNDLALDEKPQ